jgi:hypothetical protein
MHAHSYIHTNRLSTIKIIWDSTNTYYLIGEGIINYQIKILNHRNTISSPVLFRLCIILDSWQQHILLLLCIQAQ